MDFALVNEIVHEVENSMKPNVELKKITCDFLRFRPHFLNFMFIFDADVIDLFEIPKCLNRIVLIPIDKIIHPQSDPQKYLWVLNHSQLFNQCESIVGNV